MPLKTVRLLPHTDCLKLITHFSPQIFFKFQTGYFSVSGFLVKSFMYKTRHAPGT